MRNEFRTQMETTGVRSAVRGVVALTATPAACGHDDNEAQDSRLKALSGLDFYQVGGDDGMLRKHSLEAGARAVAIQNFMEELEEMEGSFDDDGEEGDVVVENRKSVSADL